MKNFDCSTVDKPTPDLKSSEVTRNTLTNEKAIHDYQQRQRKRSNYLMKCFRPYTDQKHSKRSSQIGRLVVQIVYMVTLF